MWDIFGIGAKKAPKKDTLQDLFEKESRAKLEMKERKKTDPVGPRMAAAQNVVRIVIWSFIGIVFLAGVYTMVRSKQPKIVKTIVEYNYAPSESDTAKAFAEAFTREYLTYNSDRQDYLKRIGDFLPNKLLGVIQTDVVGETSEVINAFVWDVDKLNKDYSNITVRAKIQVTNKENKAVDKNVYLSVPIRYVDGQYVVDDHPAFVMPVDKKPEIDIETYDDGKLAEEGVKKEIAEVLNNFFDTYAKGNVVQISYFMIDNKKLKGFENSFSFEGIRSLMVYQQKDVSNEAIAICEVNFKDPDISTIFNQRYNLELQKDETEKRWYIKSMNIRGDIIKDQGETDNEK